MNEVAALKGPFPQLNQSRLFQQTPGSDSLAAWFQLQATPNVETNPETLSRNCQGTGCDAKAPRGLA